MPQPQVREGPRWSRFWPEDVPGNNSRPSPGEVARAVLRAARIESAPVDLARIVLLWSGLHVGTEHLDGAGYLLDLGKAGGEILLRDRDSAMRQRFTLAHEIGHWLLGDPNAPRSRADAHDDSVVERWCDLFAAELLLPEELVTPHLDGLPARRLASRVIGFPALFEVSRSFGYSRLAELTELSILLRRFNVQESSRGEFYFTRRCQLTSSHVALKRRLMAMEKPPRSLIIDTSNFLGLEVVITQIVGRHSVLAVGRPSAS